MIVPALLLLATVLVANADQKYTDEAIQDQITSLPGTEGLGEIPFNQFSGYLKVSETKNLHYWFVESQNSVSTDPIAFWTNGGPGCSGLLGFLTEQGPFRPNKDLTLSYNEYAWNNVANMVFIEAPCGVGFSYSDNPDVDYHTDDKQTATDNYGLIQEFMTRFPQFRSNDLYITSESYGGHYMPTLAKEIVDQNTAVGVDSEKLLNFKGFAVGNPQTTFYSAIPASLETYWGHQLISKPLWDEFSATCRKGNHGRAREFAKCEELFLAMYKEIGNLNPYALDYPVCTDDNRKEAKAGRSQRVWMMNNFLDSMGAMEGSNPDMIKSMKESLKLVPVEGYEPCAEDYMTTYLNTAEVKAAIHVKDDIVWEDCSRTLRYKQGDGMNSMTPYYNYLLDGGFDLDIMVYSGDDDDVCATVGTQSWIWDLGYNVTSHWKEYTVADQTAGYITKWGDQRFALATVHGAGHEVPTYKPEVALDLFSRYLKGEVTK